MSSYKEKLDHIDKSIDHLRKERREIYYDLLNSFGQYIKSCKWADHCTIIDYNNKYFITGLQFPEIDLLEKHDVELEKGVYYCLYWDKHLEIYGKNAHKFMKKNNISI